jgi:CheY-like chemotaxis protein/AraC-like DNA-binding protein
MTLIISPLEKLISENKNQNLQKVYLLMYRNAQRILQLINQWMDVRKIDKGLMTMNFRETNIVGFIDDLMQTFEYQAEKNHIQFSFIHADEQLKVWIDLNNFDKVLVNILSNAFKFTPRDGKITVILQHRDDNYEIIISDTGPGIEESKIEKIFERFYQIKTNEQETYLGTGIGLHLARSLVELQHGILYARNRTDCKGSEFIIRLPLGNAHLNSEEEIKEDAQSAKIIHTPSPIDYLHSMDEEKMPKVKSKKKYRILIVEDEKDIRQYLKEELSDIYPVFEAVNGKEALDFILKEKPDLVVSDVMMPEMDGITLTKKLKSNINVNHIPVILLTAKTTDEDKAEGFDTGADAYISKPFNIDLLKKVIDNILENRERLKQRAVNSSENKSLIEPIVLRSSDQLLYEKIIKIINDNITDPDLNVEFLANGVGMSRVHMHRKLKELTNQSARDFIRTFRLKQAANLLSNQKLTISEVAYAVGFSNLSHFSNSFREFYGVSPKEFQQQ